eukprot:TRINITY_DN1352_c0_g1_i2.p1 TRINITY_DN1352_c0_g1~~TRINITY_DN1352_c0_g1_i2.p1  ORF type:complete len:674 (-),score=268.50 TRINITY_DN1352_c0_g1_i2:99-2120(-)
MTDNAAITETLKSLSHGIPLDPLPSIPELDRSVPHAPKRTPNLTPSETKLALQNALRYFPENLHADLAKEFLSEFHEHGHIYMSRFRPTAYKMRAYPIGCYPARCRQAAAIMLMIQNNLDPAVAQFPHELITYGGNGSVFQNWAQYHLVMKYLSEITEEQTLVMYSGHPMGLFPSHKDAPRVVITNGMVIPNYSSREEYEKMHAMGVTMYGQMTAGSYCYIGPQGIVHGTTITALNAGRKYLGCEDLTGKVLITSGLGGMSGAQPKAAYICKAVCVVAEVSEAALDKRHAQGWVMEKETDLEKLVARVREAKQQMLPVSIGFLGNIVDVWERFAQEEENLVELGSDQTSLHNPFNGGYYPVGISFDEANKIMAQDPPRFKKLVEESLRRHVDAINKLSARGMKFWDYGNSFLLESKRAKADVLKEDGTFKYPSYVQDIMGDVFSLGFGPFRWVCTSGSEKDLELTDKIAEEVICELLETAPEWSKMQYSDNLLWIRSANSHKLVVGTQARILYAEAQGRMEIAARFNKAVADGKISAPIVISRDHHDVSGTDSPFRETSNITDGSSFCADMAVQNFAGDSFRGATWVSLHNGGGVGWGEVINGGFGMVLDGSDDATRRSKLMLHWDVNNGVARRAWAGNDNARKTIELAMQNNPLLKVTLANTVDQSILDKLF